MWRRFRPRTRGKLNDPTVYEGDTLYVRARAVVDEAMHAARTGHGRRSLKKRAAKAASALRERDSYDAEHLLALLILDTPSAASAQHEMDTHRGGYKNRQARLFELIDFNDTFVDTVLALRPDQLPDFNERVYAEMKVFCAKIHASCFSEEQFEAIHHGLSREIAVFRGAHALGYRVHMTSRVQDARGIDMIITDPKTHKSINVDVKTHSAFHFRLIELKRRSRIDEARRLDCELAGFCRIVNGGRGSSVETVLLRIATDHLGPIKNFAFVDLVPLQTLLRRAIERDGRYVVDAGGFDE